MPGLKRTTLPAGYTALEQEARTIGEEYDCTVKAIALTTGCSYAMVHKALSEAGRKHGKRCSDEIWLGAIHALGFRAIRWTSRDIVAMIHSYPKGNIHSITTHHPRRFHAQWRNTGHFILRSWGHVSACIDGQVHDWAINRSLRVREIYAITKA